MPSTPLKLRKRSRSFESEDDVKLAQTSRVTKKDTRKVKQKAKQDKDNKAARNLMDSLGGMKHIKQAEKYQRLSQWTLCVDAYELGIEELEKSLQTLEDTGLVQQSVQKECQQIIDGYCRITLKLRRQHHKDMAKNETHRLSPGSVGRAKSHSRSSTGGFKNGKSNTISKKRRSVNLSVVPAAVPETDMDEQDQQAVFGTKGRRRSSSNAVVPVTKKNNENNEGNRTGTGGKEDDGVDDLFGFLDRSDGVKKHKQKMKRDAQEVKKATKLKNKAKKEEKKGKKQQKKKKEDKKKKKGKKKGKEDSKEEDEEDEEEDKKKSKLSKQDAEFRSRLEADIISEAPDVCFKDVQGLANVKLALYETIILPALRPEIFVGLREPTAGLLLFGPPGNGKTMIAKCVAAGCQSTFFSISASSITSKFVGDAERIMRTLFNLAREKAPSIIFIDEIDSMLTARGGKSEAESSRRIKTEFLIQFDGVKKKSDSAKRVLVIGATNLPDQLDEAVLRRFGKRIMVPLPDSETRLGILRLLMSKQKTNLSDKDYKWIVSKCDGYSCSDLSTLCKDAAMGPIRSLGAKILEIKNQADMPAIKKSHFDQSLKNVRPSLSAESLGYFQDWNDKFGSKIHLSIQALPDDMRPYTEQELREIERKREEEEARLAAQNESESESEDSEVVEDQSD